ncbi:hypothetical protein OBV_45380 [Oscillibacter valericigenes Sjm18-20]|nr:hypothetical protein OBV_45380 [Oscillibacter valericigenes Sjm18-20]
MLRKLMKHEFRATARIMGPLFLIVLVLALAANLALRFLMESDTFLPNLLGGLLMAAFVIGMVALAIMSIVLMVNRFRTNLMGDEGYVTFTLPVSSHQIVWSKIIVSTVWFIATGVVEAIALLVCFFNLDVMRDIFSSEFFRQAFHALHELIKEYGLNVPAIAIELIVLCLLSCAVLCLEFYAAMAVGHSFANHKGALSVLFFFVFQFAIQFISGLFFNADEFEHMFNAGMNGMQAFHQMMAIFIGMELVIGAVYYVITTFTLKKRLNLQ